MTKANIPTPETLRKLLRYEPETGKLFWLRRPVDMFNCERLYQAWNAQYAGKEAFTTTDGRGYRQGGIFRRLYSAHRVAWALQSGKWPANQIDHINGNKSDNRLVNLREATNSENSKNQGIHKDNTSGVKGVSWHKGANKWQAAIMSNGKLFHLGYFCDIDDAAAAYAKAAIKYHGDFARGANK